MILDFWINKNNLIGYCCAFSVAEMAGMCVRMRKMLFPCLVFWDQTCEYSTEGFSCSGLVLSCGLRVEKKPV